MDWFSKYNSGHIHWVHSKMLLWWTCQEILTSTMQHRVVLIKRVIKREKYKPTNRHSPKSWDNDSMKQPPWKVNLTATEEWNHEPPKVVIENNVSLPQHHKNQIAFWWLKLKFSEWVKCINFIVTIKHNKHWEERVAVHIKCI